MTTKIHIVRHGSAYAYHPKLSTAKVKIKVRQGPDFPLNATGRSQAKSLGSELQNIHFDSFYTSPLTRAWETADELNNYIHGDFPIEDNDIREIERPPIVYGAPNSYDKHWYDSRLTPEEHEFEKFRWAKNQEYKSGLALAVANFNLDWKFEGQGESFRELFERVVSFNQRLLSTPGQHKLFVSHSNFDAFEIGHLLLGDHPSPKDLFKVSWSHYLRHGGLAIISYRHGRWEFDRFDHNRRT